MPAAGGTNRITNDELGRRMERLEDDLKSLGAGIHRRLDELNYVHPETLDTKLLLEQAHRGDLERRVATLEGTVSWLARALGGALISGAAGIIFFAARGG